MKRILLLLAGLVITFVIIGCLNPFSGRPETDSKKIPKGYGAVRISIVHGSGRTALPDIEGLDYLTYVFFLEKLNEENNVFVLYDEADDTEIIPGAKEADNNGNYTFILLPGQYRLTVDASIGGGVPTTKLLVATGDANFSVVASKPEDILIRLDPITVDVSGTLKLSVDYVDPENGSEYWIENLSLINYFSSDSKNLVYSSPVISPSLFSLYLISKNQLSYGAEFI